MQLRKPAFASITTALLVATAAAAWAVASPAGIGCALAEEQASISAAPGDSAGFVAAINNLRASKGLNPLAVDGNLAGVAQGWANTMALADGISHRADLRSGITGNWQTLGENVGVGPDVNQLMQAFIASPGHYKNLVDPRFTHIGVGTVRTSSGLLYTAHEFMAVRGAAVAAAPAPVAPAAATPRIPAAPRVRTTAAPRPVVTTAPPTTAAPTTTAPPVPTTLKAEVKFLPADHQLDDGSKHDQQQQESKSNGRCRAHLSNLQALVK